MLHRNGFKNPIGAHSASNRALLMREIIAANTGEAALDMLVVGIIVPPSLRAQDRYLALRFKVVLLPRAPSSLYLVVVHDLISPPERGHIGVGSSFSVEVPLPLISVTFKILLEDIILPLGSRKIV